MIRVFIILSVFFSHVLCADDIPSYELSNETINTINDLTDQKLKESLNIRINDIKKTLNSNEWEKKQIKMRRVVAKTLDVDLPPVEIDTQDRVIVFISSSIPIQTLRNYAIALDKIGGVMVMRGAIGGLKSLKETAIFSSEILKIRPWCKTQCQMRGVQILIDPILFRKYDIKAVPAMTYQKNLHLNSYCHNTDPPKINNLVIYGDASLGGMIDEYLDIKKEGSLEKLKYLL